MDRHIETSCSRREFIAATAISAAACLSTQGRASAAALPTDEQSPALIRNRFLTFNTVVRVNQIEVSRDRVAGSDEGQYPYPRAGQVVSPVRRAWLARRKDHLGLQLAGPPGPAAQLQGDPGSRGRVPCPLRGRDHLHSRRVFPADVQLAPADPAGPARSLAEGLGHCGRWLSAAERVGRVPGRRQSQVSGGERGHPRLPGEHLEPILDRQRRRRRIGVLSLLSLHGALLQAGPGPSGLHRLRESGRLDLRFPGRTPRRVRRGLQQPHGGGADRDDLRPRPREGCAGDAPHDGRPF